MKKVNIKKISFITLMSLMIFYCCACNNSNSKFKQIENLQEYYKQDTEGSCPLSLGNGQNEGIIIPYINNLYETGRSFYVNCANLENGLEIIYSRSGIAVGNNTEHIKEIYKDTKSYKSETETFIQTDDYIIAGAEAFDGVVHISILQNVGTPEYLSIEIIDGSQHSRDVKELAECFLIKNIRRL